MVQGGRNHKKQSRSPAIDQLKRAVVTSERGNVGNYSAAVLLPGLYEVAAEAAGFKRLARETSVEAGSTATVNLWMQVGPGSESLKQPKSAHYCLLTRIGVRAS